MQYRPFVIGLLLLNLALCLGVSAAPRTELNLWVVEASTKSVKEPVFGKGLEAIRGVLAPLPHDTYELVTSGKHGLATSGATRVPIDDEYTLEAGAPVDAADGRYRIRLRILMKNTKKTPPEEIEALSTELLLGPDKQVLVRGLKLKSGEELILVLSLSLPPKTQVAK